MDAIQKTLIKAGRKDLAQKYFEAISKRDPKDEFKRQSGDIDKNLKTINSEWKKIKAKYQKQLKDEPNSWKGIGAGSELGHMVSKTKELIEALTF